MSALFTAQAAVRAVFDPLPYAARLHARVRWLVTRLMAAPAASFPQAFGAAGYTAFKRVLHNPRVHETSPWTAVTAATGRAVAGRRVLLAHDATEMRFGGTTRRAGLGRLNVHDQGFVAMTALALDRDAPGRVLGVAACTPHVRPDARRGATSHTVIARDPARESRLWGASLAASAPVVAGAAAVLHLFDAGADDYGFLATLVGGGHAFVVRATQDRCTTATAPDGRAVHVSAWLAAAARAVATRDVVLARRAATRKRDATQAHAPRAARAARLEIRATAATLRRPAHAARDLPATLPLHLVQVREVDAPPGVEPVEWWLWTTEPIATAADVLAVVDAYLARWTIEEFFCALKTGCAYETRQLEGFDALWLVLAFFCPIATQLLNLRRAPPTTPAADVVPAAILAAARVLDPRHLAEPDPSVATLVRAIARIGGHLPHNGPPGWRILLRGYAEVMRVAAGWDAAMQAVAAASSSKSDPS